MKRIQTIIVLTTLLAVSAGAAPMPAVEWTQISGIVAGTVRATFGWRFHVSDDTDVWVSALGVYDHFSNGLNSDHDVAIWPVAGGAPLARATVPAGTVVDLQGHFRYVNIPRIRLASGTDYVIGSDGWYPDENMTGFDPAAGMANFAPGISDLALRFSTEMGTTNRHLVFPDEDRPSPPTYFVYGPSFLVSPAPPEVSIRTSQVELCWDTRTNKWYQLEYRSLLTTNQWALFMTNWFAGDGNRFCTNDVVDQVQRYYRLAVTNSPPQ